MKNTVHMALLALLSILTAYNSYASANNKLENNTDNSVIILKNISDINELEEQSDATIEYVTLPNGTMVGPGIPDDVVDMVFTRIKAIAKGDLAAFRSTLGEIQDGVDFYYQLGLIFRYFGDFFDIDPDVFDDAVANGTENLQKIANTLFNSERPIKSRKTRLFVKKIEIISGSGLTVTVKNNKNEEFVYNFLYY